MQVTARATVLLTVRDVLARTAVEMARIGGKDWRGKIVLHPSGALGSTVLWFLKSCGAGVASRHPLQSFSGKGIPPLEGRIFGSEGDAPAVGVTRRIAPGRRGTPGNRTAANKALYRAAGAFAAGTILAMEVAGVHGAVASHEQALQEFCPEVLERYKTVNRLAARVLSQEPRDDAERDGNDFGEFAEFAKSKGR